MAIESFLRLRAQVGGTWFVPPSWAREGKGKVRRGIGRESREVQEGRKGRKAGGAEGERKGKGLS